MTSNFLNRQIDGILGDVLEEASGTVYMVNPASEAIDTLVDVARAEGAPTIRVLAEDQVLKDVMTDFIVASNAADLIEAGTLELKTTPEPGDNSMVITADRVVAIVSAGDRVGGLSTDDAEFTDAAYEAAADRWEAAEAFNLRTPAFTTVRDTLTTDIGPTAESDFSAIIDSLETARGDGDGLDEVTISLLVAARNEALLYDISKWGEDVGIASKATFSRTKTKLEDRGLIDTEKVPIDVGRPRLRLKLADNRLRDANTGQLASVAQSILN
ncbi:MAG: DUF5821 family protein [Natrialbaceae archaeon]|nr:DUF5821 family protein [Natrialbaceae archaeon]